MSKHKDRERHHGEAPDDAECVQARQRKNVALGENNREQLQDHDQVDDAVTRPEAGMGLLKCSRQNSILGNSIQNAIRAHDRSILRAGQNQNAHQDHKSMKCEPGPFRSNQVHGDSANEVAEILGPDFIRNDHHSKKRHQGGEQQAVDENYQTGFFQVLKLGMSDLAIDLGQGFLTAHGQHRVPETHKNDDERQ